MLANNRRQLGRGTGIPDADGSVRVGRNGLRSTGGEVGGPDCVRLTRECSQEPAGFRHPDPGRSVRASGHDCLPVGAEPDGRYGRCVSDEQHESDTAAGVVNTGDSVGTGGRDQPTIRAEGHCQDPVEGGLEHVQQPPGANIPEASGVVLRAGHDESTVGTEGRRAHETFVAKQT